MQLNKLAKQEVGKLKCGSVIGRPVTSGSFANVSKEIIAKARESKSGYVCVANVHMVVTSIRNSLLKQAMQSSLMNISDGMPLVWELRRLGFHGVERVSGPDLMVDICKKAEKYRLPIYFYGGADETICKMGAKLTREFPNLILAGLEAPPMLTAKPKVDPNVIHRIKDSEAKIVFVGLGCPKQELWMHAYTSHVPAIMIGVGAAFDFFAGDIKRAPRWMQQYGVEWLYRLLQDPKRLWKRYLVTNSLFITYWIIERVRRKK